MSKRKADIRKWLDLTPNEDGWLTLTYKEISAQIHQVCNENVAPSTITHLLPLAVADKLGIEPSEVIRRRQEYRKKARGQMTSPETLQAIREWRTQSNPVEVIDIAYRLDVTPGRIEQILRRYNIP